MLDKFQHITTFVFDVDGVLTDGSLLVLSDGLMARRMNIKDGYALQLAVKRGYHVLVISGGHSPEVKDRLTKLGVKNIWMQKEDKQDVLKSFMDANNIHCENVLYMGDDVPDKKVMLFSGLPCCPEDAVQEVKEIAVYISPVKGGEGCVRDVIEKVMRLRGDWGEEAGVRSQ